MRIPVAGPDERTAPPLRATLLLTAGTEWAIAHPERSTAVGASFLRLHRLAWLVMFAFRGDWFSKELAPALLGCKATSLGGLDIGFAD